MVFQRPSQRPSQSAIFLSELRVVLPLIVLPLKTPAIFGLEDPSHCVDALQVVSLEVPRAEMVSLQVFVGRHRTIALKSSDANQGRAPRETIGNQVSKVGMDFGPEGGVDSEWIFCQRQKSAEGILRLRNPNLGPNSGKRILDSRILDPNSRVEFFDSVFPSKRGPLKNSPSRNSPPKIHIEKFTPEFGLKISHCTSAGPFC